MGRFAHGSSCCSGFLAPIHHTHCQVHTRTVDPRLEEPRGATKDGQLSYATYPYSLHRFGYSLGPEDLIRNAGGVGGKRP